MSDEDQIHLLAQADEAQMREKQNEITNAFCDKMLKLRKCWICSITPMRPVKEPCVEVKITEKVFTLEEYVKRHIPAADYQKAFEMAKLFLKMG